jgi:hypothetical protein
VAALKAFIIFRDRVTYARQCAASLAAAGLDVCLVDCGSTWPEAVQWADDMEAAGGLVLRRGGGRHPRDLWAWEPFRQACGDGRYIVTDPDVVPSDDCPGDWVDRLHDALDASGKPKAGLGLRLDRIPGHYQRREKVLSWEAQFWERPLDDGTFDAIIDTTLALYRPLAESSAFHLEAVRTGPPYLADHLAWYEDFEDLPPDLEHYHEHADRGISYWTVPGRSVWGD